MHGCSFWRDVRAVYPPSRLPFLFSNVRARRVTGRRAGQPGRKWNSTEIALKPKDGRWMPGRCANIVIRWHISLVVAAQCALRLPEPLRYALEWTEDHASFPGKIVLVPAYGPNRPRSSSIQTSGGKSCLWQ